MLEAPSKCKGAECLSLLPVCLSCPVLVNEHTASASEILAGAIKDNCRGVLVGKRTYGKVSCSGSAYGNVLYQHCHYCLCPSQKAAIAKHTNSPPG